ncbi:MAG: protein kinase [Pyrinomonadaceae bacterium]
MPVTKALLQEGRYRIDNEFPQDGEGCIYEAFDTTSETKVIVKEIPIKLNKVATASQRESQNAAFAEQAKLLKEIRHASLLHVRDCFSEIGHQYLVMESIDGDDFETLLSRHARAFPVSDIVSWAYQLLDALYYLHTNLTPIIHGNIRPENIKLNSDGKVKLAPFGSVFNGEGQNSADGSTIPYSPLEQIWSGLDAASQKVITNKYDESSERILKSDLDARSDVYSLGATLYHLITARAPADALERSIEIIEGRPDPLLTPEKIDPSIPVEISDLIMKAMEIKREYRFDSAVIMHQVFRTALVRVKEREAEEALDQVEAANDLKAAEQKRLQNSDGEKIGETELIKQQLKEAETQRLLAEQRAAEAEKKLHESESARFAVPETPVASADTDLDDDLLGILNPSIHTSSAPKPNAPVENISLVGIVENTPAKNVQSEAPTVEELATKEQNPIVEEVVESIDENTVVNEPETVELESVESPVEEVTQPANDAVKDESTDEKYGDISLAEPERAEKDQIDETAADEVLVATDDLADTTNNLGEEPSVEAAVEDKDDAEEISVEEPIEPVHKEVAVAAQGSSVQSSPQPIEPVHEEVAVAAQVSSVQSSPQKTLNGIFTEPEHSGFINSMPVLGIGAGVIAVLAIGFWMFMSSGSAGPAGVPSTNIPPTTQTSLANSTVKTDTESTTVPVASQTDQQPSAVPADAPPTAAKPVAAPAKQKKVAPVAAKSPAAKKPVTVDDLINDN